MDSGWYLVIPLIVAGCGLGMLVSQLNNFTLAPISEDRVSEAAGVLSAGGGDAPGGVQQRVAEPFRGDSHGVMPADVVGVGKAVALAEHFLAEAVCMLSPRRGQLPRRAAAAVNFLRIWRRAGNAAIWEA